MATYRSEIGQSQCTKSVSHIISSIMSWKNGYMKDQSNYHLPLPKTSERTAVLGLRLRICFCKCSTGVTSDNIEEHWRNKMEKKHEC